MANSNKNIVITPNIGSSTADPKIVFSGADSSTAAQNITMTMYPANNGTLSIDGSAGQLFSVSNSLTGTLFSVNDISGVPSIEVLDTGVVKLAQYNGSVGIGTGAPTANLHVESSGAGASMLVKSTSTVNTSFAEMAVTGNDVTLRLSAYGSTHSSRGNTTWLNANTATSSLILSTGNTERMRIDTAGKVLIGTTSAAAVSTLNVLTSIRVQGQAGVGNRSDYFVDTSSTNLNAYNDTLAQYRPFHFTGSDFWFSVGTTGNIAALTIDSSGNFGFNTTSPLSYLNGAGSGGVAIKNITGPSVLQLVDSSGTNGFGMYVGPGTDQATLLFTSSMRFGSTTSSNGTTGYTERMRVAGDGNLLIGLTGSLISTAKLQLSDGTITSVFGYKTGAAEYLGTTSSHPLCFLVANAERMRITSTGALSIGAGGTNYGTSNQHLISNGNAAPTWASQPFAMSQFTNGKPLASEILVKMIMPFAVSMPVNLTTSFAKCVIAATSAVTINILKNGAQAGTCTFAAGATTGTFSITALTFTGGDILVFQIQSTVDATFSDVAFTIVGSLT